MQKLKQFLHWLFIKNHDFFGFKISMDFWMFFSLKMASKSKPFSMKKPSKKQDVFRASQKSFFLRSWSAPGQCPMTVFIFFFGFFDFWPKMVCPGVARGTSTHGLCGPSVPGPAPFRVRLLVIYQQDMGAGSDTPWAVGPANFKKQWLKLWIQWLKGLRIKSLIFESFKHWFVKASKIDFLNFAWFIFDLLGMSIYTSLTKRSLRVPTQYLKAGLCASPPLVPPHLAHWFPPFKVAVSNYL